jgi:DMSO reductase anchor subunit
MHPAFSVIVFTTLSGAGYGLLALVGAALANPRLVTIDAAPLVIVLLLLGKLMATVGLLSSTFHLGKPLRAWRAFSQWRTSWLSREGVLSMLTYLPAAALVVVAIAAVVGGDGARTRAAMLAPVFGPLLAILAVFTVACTAMIYASLKPIPAWAHRLVVPVYLLFAVQSGLAVGLLVLALDNRTAMPASLMPVVAALGVVLAVLKRRYWRDIDRTPLPARPGDAVGLPGREVRVFERPHTEGSYITREMGFVVARKHARRLRAIALALFGGVPVLAMLAVWWLPAAQVPVVMLATLSVLAGAFVERWLFFAQARHLVTLYY